VRFGSPELTVMVSANERSGRAALKNISPNSLMRGSPRSKSVDFDGNETFDGVVD
jgi:hypothetical protein